MATSGTLRKGLQENPWIVQRRYNGSNVSSSERPPGELVYTSQGRPQDKPPENWIRPELIAFNAMSEYCLSHGTIPSILERFASSVFNNMQIRQSQDDGF
jgi:hypothetical protein